jgi:hypothetical protein
MPKYRQNHVKKNKDYYSEEDEHQGEAKQEEVEEEEEYEVEKILDKKWNRSLKCFEYYIKWLNYGP